MVAPFHSFGSVRVESQNSDTALQLADDGWLTANLIPNQNMHPQILYSRPEQSPPIVSNERVPPGNTWLAPSTTMNLSSGFPDVRRTSSPPGGPVLSNLYPTQSSIPPHNIYLESLQASMTSPPSGFQRALNVAPMEAERFIGQIPRQVQPHFLNNPSVPPFPQPHSSYNAYPTPDYRNYFTALPHESSRNFGFGFGPYRPPPGTHYPFHHNNHSNIFTHGNLPPLGNPTHNFQQHHHLSGFLPIEYGPAGMIHRSFYAPPPHMVPSPPITHQATLRGNGSTLNAQVNGRLAHRPFLPRHFPASNSPRVKVNKSSQQLSRLESGQSSSSGGGRQIRRINNLSPSTRSSLLEEFRTHRDKPWTMKEIHGYIIEFSGDQHGSRFIQQQLEEVGDDEKQKAFQEIVPHKTDDLIRDVFGNYVIQKFFEFGTPAQKDILAKAVDEQIVELSLQIYGCRVVQKAIEYISGDQQADFIRRLEPHILTCVKDAHGNHVIQKLVEVVKPERLTFLPLLADHILDLATHPYGCRVLQRCLEHLPDEYTRSLLEAIHHYTIELMQDQYGNYVIQFILEQGHDEDKAIVVSQIQGNLVNLAHHKYASNVCEKALICTDSASREMLISEMMAVRLPNTESPILIMAKDQYANYVIQRALTVVDGEQKDLFFNNVKSMLSVLRRSTTAYYRPLVSMERLMDRYFDKQVVAGRVPLENRILKC